MSNFAIAYISIGCGMIVNATLLIVGAAQKRKAFILSWLVVTAIAIVVNFIASISLQMFAGIGQSVVASFYWCVVFSFRSQLKKEEAESQQAASAPEL